MCGIVTEIVTLTKQGALHNGIWTGMPHSGCSKLWSLRCVTI